MDRGAWLATVHGVARVRHDLSTEHKNTCKRSEQCSLKKGHWWCLQSMGSVVSDWGRGVLSSSSIPRNRGLVAEAGAELPKALRERSSSDIFQSNSHWLVPTDGPKESPGYPTGHDTGLDKRSEKNVSGRWERWGSPRPLCRPLLGSWGCGRLGAPAALHDDREARIGHWSHTLPRLIVSCTHLECVWQTHTTLQAQGICVHWLELLTENGPEWLTNKHYTLHRLLCCVPEGLAWLTESMSHFA